MTRVLGELIGKRMACHDDLAVAADGTVAELDPAQLPDRLVDVHYTLYQETSGNAVRLGDAGDPPTTSHGTLIPGGGSHVEPGNPQKHQFCVNGTPGAPASIIATFYGEQA